MPKAIHFIFSGTQNAIGGGTKVWKTLLKDPPVKIHLHYSSFAENIWNDFRFDNLIHCVHKNWKTFENRNYKVYDESYRDFNLNSISDGDLVVFDSREGLQQLALPLSKKFPNVKMIWHMQSEEHMLRRNLMVTYKDLMWIQKLSLIISVSKWVKERFESDPIYRFFSKKIPIEIVYHAVKSSFKEIKAKYNYVLFFGRYESYKNPLFLEKINAEVRYIGGKTGCTKPVNVPKEKDLGWMTPEKAATYGDIFIFPSIGEAFGLTLLEMMSYGKICIAFNSGAFRELIENEKNGFLIRPFDYKVANKIIHNIQNNKELKEKISNNAIEKAKKFSLENFKENFYEKVKLSLSE